MPLLSLVLFGPPAALTLPIIFSKRGMGPEGPVGFHMVTGPLALLEAAALAILIHRGIWDFFPGARAAFDIALAGYVVTMTILPVLALPGQKGRGWAQAGTVAVLAAGLTASVAAMAGSAPPAIRITVGAALAVPCLAGYTMLAAVAMAAQANAIRRAEEAVERGRKFDEEQAAFDVREWAKLPADPGLWQLMTFVYSRNPEVQKACRERIAARPALEADMIALLGSGWAKYGADYIRDFYSLPAAPLAPAYGKYLEAEFEAWRSTLANDANPAGWIGNLRPLVDAAEKIVKAGGDLRGPLEKWRAFAKQTRGLEELDRRIGETLAPPA